MATPTEVKPFVFDRKRDTWVCLHHGDQEYPCTVQCWSCGGEGGQDEHEYDPVNFAPGEQWDTCNECGGPGEFMLCPVCNADNPDAEF